MDSELLYVWLKSHSKQPDQEEKANHQFYSILLTFSHQTDYIITGNMEQTSRQKTRGKNTSGYQVYFRLNNLIVHAYFSMDITPLEMV
jgi:hypothetical protein